MFCLKKFKKAEQIVKSLVLNKGRIWSKLLGLKQKNPEVTGNSLLDTAELLELNCARDPSAMLSLWECLQWKERKHVTESKHSLDSSNAYTKTAAQISNVQIKTKLKKRKTKPFLSFFVQFN